MKCSFFPKQISWHVLGGGGVEVNTDIPDKQQLLTFGDSVIATIIQCNILQNNSLLKKIDLKTTFKKE